MKDECVREWEKALEGTVCPITKRRFFMMVPHPTAGWVPTYGGPFDSYTVPTLDEDGELWCEIYDHDRRGWLNYRDRVGLRVVKTDEEEL